MSAEEEWGLTGGQSVVVGEEELELREGHCEVEVVIGWVPKEDQGFYLEVQVQEISWTLEKVI